MAALDSGEGGGSGPGAGGFADLHHRDRHRGAGGQAAGLVHQRGGAGPTGEGHHEHGGGDPRGGVGLGPGHSQLKQLPVADRPRGPAMALPLGRHDQRRPAQLMGGPGDRGIGAAGPAVEQQMDKPAAAAGQQLCGNALMGPGQITAATGSDHK